MQEVWFTEKIVRLPHSYQANDDRRIIVPDRRGRRAWGLPEHGFVFCCFNHTYKIGPDAFTIWMRLLGAVKGSVLWLLRSNPWAEQNLRREAAARGIDPAAGLCRKRSAWRAPRAPGAGRSVSRYLRGQCPYNGQ